jgi:PAS domain S-box-containing protein
MIGTIPPEIIDAILETVPLEITVLDENDRIIGWNTRRPRIFGRPAEVLGRDVRGCHSEKSLGLLETILGEMKAGTRERARFWYDESVGDVPRKILVEYCALRDMAGRYIGCVEALQDIEGFRSLEGEKRTLDD